MAASLGFPFTSAQWTELERQAMIYKYMMASDPVPADLLIPASLTTSASSRSPCMTPLLFVVVVLAFHRCSGHVVFVHAPTEKGKIPPKWLFQPLF